jgi:hypothetical protein
VNCFFDGIGGVKGCSGKVRHARGGDSEMVKMCTSIRKPTGYCEVHEQQNVKHARWGNVKLIRVRSDAEKEQGSGSA